MADTTAGKAVVEGSLAGAIATFVISITPMLPHQWQPVAGPAVGLAVAIVKAARHIWYKRNRALYMRRRDTDRRPG